MRISDWSSDVCSSDLLRPEAAMAFRSHIASVRAAPGADEESFRLITGFNDIFVSIAAVILLVAVGWIGASIHTALGGAFVAASVWIDRSAEHTSELQSLMRISYAVFCLKKKYLTLLQLTTHL